MPRPDPPEEPTTREETSSELRVIDPNAYLNVYSNLFFSLSKIKHCLS
jgi:hypothetical protein